MWARTFGPPSDLSIPVPRHLRTQLPQAPQDGIAGFFRRLMKGASEPNPGVGKRAFPKDPDTTEAVASEPKGFGVQGSGHLDLKNRISIVSCRESRPLGQIRSSGFLHLILGLPPLFFVQACTTTIYCTSQTKVGAP